MNYLTSKFQSISFTPRRLRATEAQLERIYHAAYAGLTGESLALASGMLPVDFNALIQSDENAELIVKRGKADSEMEHAILLAEASRSGDAKASLAILQHKHEWAAKQKLDINVQQVHVAHLDAIRALADMYEPAPATAYAQTPTATAPAPAIIDSTATKVLDDQPKPEPIRSIFDEVQE